MPTDRLRTRLRSIPGALAVTALLAATVLPDAQALPRSSPVPTAELGGSVVYDLVVLDTGRVILGGNFTAIGPFPRANLGAILPNGEPDPEFAPTTDGSVHAVAISEDGSRVFIGGTFTQVDGQPRHNIAAIDAVTGALIEDWEADTAGAVPMVSSLAVDGDRLYVGGRFSTIDGVNKEKLAAVDVTSGNIVAWSTWVNGAVNEVRVAPDGTVWVGGEFTRIRGIARPYFGGIDPATGQPTAFNGLGNDSRLITLALSPDGQWVFTANNSNFVTAYKVRSTTPRWSRHADGNAQALVATDRKVYIGGHFTAFDDDGIIPRRFFAAVVRRNGAMTAWDPHATGSNKGVWSLAIHQGSLHAAGGFIYFSGVRQRLFAKFGGTA